MSSPEFTLGEIPTMDDRHIRNYMGLKSSGSLKQETNVDDEYMNFMIIHLLSELYKELNKYLDTYCVFKGDKADKIRKEYYRSDLYKLSFNYIIDDDFIKKYADLAEDVLQMTIYRNKLVIK